MYVSLKKTKFKYQLIQIDSENMTDSLTQRNSNRDNTSIKLLIHPITLSLFFTILIDLFIPRYYTWLVNFSIVNTLILFQLLSIHSKGMERHLTIYSLHLFSRIFPKIFLPHTWPIAIFQGEKLCRALAHQKLSLKFNFVCLLFCFLLAPCLLQVSLGMIPMNNLSSS